MGTDDKSPTQNGVEIKADTSSPKVQKVSEDSKWFSFRFSQDWGSKDSCFRPYISDRGKLPVSPPGAVNGNPKVETAKTVTKEPPLPKTKPIIQYVSNTVELKVYLMIFFSHKENGKTEEKRVYLHSSHVHEINTDRSQTWGSSAFNCMISLHEEYLVSDSLNGEPYHVSFWNLFQIGNIMDAVVFTNVKYQDWDKDANIENAKMEKKVFLIQRGALSGYSSNVSGTGTNTVTLRIETIDVYSNRTKVFITTAAKSVKGLKGSTDEVPRKDLIEKLNKSLKQIENNNKLNTIYKKKKRIEITEQLTQLKILDNKIPKSSLIEYINRATNLLKSIQKDIQINNGKGRGKKALEIVYCYIASSFKVTIGEEKVFRKVFKDMQIMGYQDDDKNPPTPLQNTLVGTVAGDNDYLFDKDYGAGTEVFKLLISLFGNTNNKEYTFSEIVPKLGLEYFHEVYYDPFVELDYTKEYLFGSKFNQIPVYSNENGDDFFFSEITKPSFVIRHKPYLAMFSLDKDEKGKEIFTMEPKGGIHVYEIPLTSIISISIDVKMSNIKTAIYFGKIFNYLKPIETEALDTIIFGSNILKIENTGWIANTAKLVGSKIVKILERAVIGSDSYTGEATITCMYSPIRVGSMARIPFIIDKKIVYAYGYIASVKDSFSATGEALTTLDLHFIDNATMFMLMGFKKENTEGTAPTLDKDSKNEAKISKINMFVNGIT